MLEKKKAVQSHGEESAEQTGKQCWGRARPREHGARRPGVGRQLGGQVGDVGVGSRWLWRGVGVLFVSEEQFQVHRNLIPESRPHNSIAPGHYVSPLCSAFVIADELMSILLS